MNETQQVMREFLENHGACTMSYKICEKNKKMAVALLERMTTQQVELFYERLEGTDDRGKITERCDRCLDRVVVLYNIYIKRHATLFVKRHQKWKRAVLEAEKKVVQDGIDLIEYLDKLQENGQTLDDLNVLASFCASHEEGNTQEPWVMGRLYTIFHQFLDDGIRGGDAKIDTFFDLKKTNFNGIRRHIDNQYNESLGSYAMLQYLFDLNNEPTAEVIKLWYSYPHSANTLQQQFIRDYKPFIDPKWKYRMDNEMTKTARATIFLEKLKADHPKAFQKLKTFKSQMESMRELPAFK